MSVSEPGQTGSQAVASAETDGSGSMQISKTRFDWRSEWRKPGSGRTLAGGFIVLCLLALALLGNRVTRYDAQDMDYEHTLVPPSIDWLRSFLVTEKGLRNLGYLPPEGASALRNDDGYGFLETEDEQETAKSSPMERKAFEHDHWFGTDSNGRDLLAMIVMGTRTALLPGLVASLIALGIGFPIGLLAGYYGGRLESAIRFLNGVLLSFPRLVLILVVVSALEPDVTLIMVVFGITMLPKISELVATRVQMVSGMGFILGAKESGLSDARIILRHLFWFQNRAVFLIQFSLVMAESILIETTLSYLKFGTKPPEVSWGNIIEGAQMTFFSESYWITFFPAVAIIISILGFFYLGDGLNARLAYKEGR